MQMNANTLGEVTLGRWASQVLSPSESRPAASLDFYRKTYSFKNGIPELRSLNDAVKDLVLYGKAPYHKKNKFTIFFPRLVCRISNTMSKPRASLLTNPIKNDSDRRAYRSSNTFDR